MQNNAFSAIFVSVLLLQFFNMSVIIMNG